MSELTGNAKTADDAILSARVFLDRFRESGMESSKVMAWFMLAYAMLRILANIADSLKGFDDAIDHKGCCVVTRDGREY